ncbi:MAG: DUF4166 domain-containing protein [Gammaproteobacteria bacterium]|nr:DUF4166 domain-containing protein [Gammaproteobacteria bacterium]
MTITQPTLLSFTPLQKTNTSPHHPQLANSSPYQKLIGQSAWNRLHPAIQNRFTYPVSTTGDNLFCKNETVIYKGVMNKVQMSLMGKILAYCCRLIGTPLALYEGENIPTTVKVYPDKNRGGMTWDRRYHFPNKPTNQVVSTKSINQNGLSELVGFGFGMKLDVNEYKGAIVFESTKFFVKIGKLKLTIPDWLTPGKTTVQQRAINNEEFEFTLRVTHKFFGQMFYQIGRFKNINQSTNLPKRLENAL